MPDGDTGTNLVLTMASAKQAVDTGHPGRRVRVGLPIGEEGAGPPEWARALDCHPECRSRRPDSPFVLVQAEEHHRGYAVIEQVFAPPPPGMTVDDLQDAIRHAAQQVAFATPPHPDQLAGWPIAWGEQLDLRPLTLIGRGEVTDSMAAGYLAKYATKSTEPTGHRSARLTGDTIDLHADPDGTHVARLIDACWRLGRPIPTPRALRDGRRLTRTCQRHPSMSMPAQGRCAPQDC